MPSFWSSDVCRSEEHTSELQSHDNLVCRLLLEKKNHIHTQAPARAAAGRRTRHPSLPPRERRDPPRPGVRGCQPSTSGALHFSLLFFLKVRAPPKSPLFPPPAPLRF